jgi:hypothetical protein
LCNCAEALSDCTPERSALAPADEYLCCVRVELP